MTRLPETVLNSVVFLGARGATGIRYGGTAFYVGIEATDGSAAHYVYLVTAKHNLDRAYDTASDGRILIRPSWADPTNTEAIATGRGQWIDHPDGADVAILDFDVRGLRYSALTSEMLLTDAKRADDHVGVGDELQIVGLFTHHRGTRQIVPIARSGSIAAMADPDEPVNTKLGPMEAYLAEVRSRGGLSGSPVFVVLPPWRKKVTPPVDAFVTHLLGLVHGHWDEPVSADDYGDPTEREKINQGIAVVVPATRILELIETPSEQAKRRAAWEEMERQKRIRRP